MRNVASFIFTSLDGFYEGPSGELDWLPIDDDFNQLAVEQLDEFDAIGFGRATYETMMAYWPTKQAAEENPEAITSRMNEKTKFVFSRSLSDASWPGTTLVRGEAGELLPGIEIQSGQRLLLMGSAHLTAELMRAGILDELRIMICPVVLGQGHSLFENLPEQLSLELLSIHRLRSGNVMLTYSPLAPK